MPGTVLGAGGPKVHEPRGLFFFFWSQVMEVMAHLCPVLGQPFEDQLIPPWAAFPGAAER